MSNQYQAALMCPCCEQTFVVSVCAEQARLYLIDASCDMTCPCGYEGPVIGTLAELDENGEPLAVLDVGDIDDEEVEGEERTEYGHECAHDFGDVPWTREDAARVLRDYIDADELEDAIDVFMAQRRRRMRDSYGNTIELGSISSDTKRNDTEPDNGSRWVSNEVDV